MDDVDKVGALVRLVDVAVTQKDRDGTGEGTPLKTTACRKTQGL